MTQPMHGLLGRELEDKGIGRLYCHQARAFDEWSVGRDVLVTTGTNSGKTLCYCLPAIQSCLTEPSAKCLFTLSDQSRSRRTRLSRLIDLVPSGPCDPRVSTYDGDTPKSQRSSIRKTAHIVLSNPDMLHVGILPGHEYWSPFLRSLRLIAIDEMHVYRGVFGSHVASVLRRLLALMRVVPFTAPDRCLQCHYREPRRVVREVDGKNGKPGVRSRDGSPSGKRTFVFWNPPELDKGGRLSANIVTSEILCRFAGDRPTHIGIQPEPELGRTGAPIRPPQRGPIRSHLSEVDRESYRAGYTVKERREIEQGLFSGRLLGLSATNAMELGVDVGALDVVVMNGYPGTSSSYWQQGRGRAGRGTRDGVAIMVAHDDPLEQFLVRQPDLLLDASHESVAINPQNVRRSFWASSFFVRLMSGPSRRARCTSSETERCRSRSRWTDPVNFSSKEACSTIRKSGLPRSTCRHPRLIGRLLQVKA